MTGFRLGYALASPQIINQINKVVQLTSSCPVNFVQDAAIVALDNIDSMRNIIREITSNRLEIVDEVISDLPVQYSRPDGAIYAWIGIDSNDSVSWSKELLEQAGVAVTPGRAFGPAGEGYVRLCFATGEESVRTGIERLGKFLST
jgi:aspartate/methionine/tyrosine aminotransferase